MVICHFFLRKLKGVRYVMVDSSADESSHPLFASPEVLFEAEGGVDRWIPRALTAMACRFPDLEPGPVCRPDDRRVNKVQCFDIPFYEKKGVLKRLCGR